ncbi:MAG: hypothetical protein ACKOYK_01850 [Cyanobium sp.]
MRRRALFPLAMVAGFLCTPFPQALADQGNPAVRAANMARMKAESLNGGLGVYRSAPCMHEQAGGSCLVQTTGEGFLFRFLGGKPGWSQLGLPPTVETELLVSPDGREIRQVVYNSPPRL